jgi:hypothetical protein
LRLLGFDGGSDRRCQYASIYCSTYCLRADDHFSHDVDHANGHADIDNSSIGDQHQLDNARYYRDYAAGNAKHRPRDDFHSEYDSRCGYHSEHDARCGYHSEHDTRCGYHSEHNARRNFHPRFNVNDNRSCRPHHLHHWSGKHAGNSGDHNSESCRDRDHQPLPSNTDQRRAGHNEFCFNFSFNRDSGESDIDSKSAELRDTAPDATDNHYRAAATKVDFPQRRRKDLNFLAGNLW